MEAAKMDQKHADSPERPKPHKIESTAAHKSQRKRTRHHYNSIRNQMEFYFGDANLSKDRFLRQLTEKDPFIPLDVFLTFNKIKSLTTSTEEIVKSISNSELLELDETQQKVRRKTVLPMDRNVDEKTLYVEALPPVADHEWVRQAFERFGKISYISLPRYAKSRRIKEFGFVEFEDEKSVTKAVKAFKEFNGVLSTQDTDPSELKSIKVYIKEQEQNAAAESENTIVTPEKKRSNAEDVVGADEPAKKKIKLEAKEIATCAAGEDSSESETENDTETDVNVLEQTDNNEASPANKKRRRKKKKLKTVDKHNEQNVSMDTSYLELKILRKHDWKRLRNKYLNLQREKVSELKRKAWKERRQQTEQQAKDATAEGGDATAPTPAKKSKPSERKLRKMNMNFYGAGEDEPKVALIKETRQNPALERAPLFIFGPGLIVEVSLLESCTQVKNFKSDMRQYGAIKYIDVKEGAMVAFLRLETAEAAEEFVRRVNCTEYKCKVLTGEAEAEYWKKIEQDREMKLNKQIKSPKKRGRENVKKLTAKYIRFDDDEEE